MAFSYFLTAEMTAHKSTKCGPREMMMHAQFVLKQNEKKKQFPFAKRGAQIM